jgi:hypothetical protein
MQAEASTQAKPVAALATAAAVIVFGRDDARKPHASQFTSDDAALAEKAAGLMGMRVLRVTKDEVATVAARLPAGRIFESGKAFVPYVSVKTFTDLEAAAGQAGPGELIEPPPSGAAEATGGDPGTEAAGASSSASEPASGAVRRPRDWDDIREGSVVLATTGPMEGWFECIVVSQDAQDSYLLRWKDWPAEPRIVRRRADMALLHTAYVEA